MKIIAIVAAAISLCAIKADIDMKAVVDATGFVLDDGTMSVRFEQAK